MTEWEANFIASHRVARLATIDAQGQPHIVPIVYAFDGDRLYTPVDAKPKRVSPFQLQRVRNIQANPSVGVLIDEYSEDWRRLAWVQVRGRAVTVQEGPQHAAAVRLLHDKYPQYAAMPLQGRPIIVITSERVTSWRAATVR